MSVVARAQPTAVEELRSTSPQDPSDVVLAVPVVGGEDVGGLISRARRAGRGWAAVSPVERARTIELAATRLEGDAAAAAFLVTREVGKPAGEARAEVARSVAILRYFAQQVLDPSGALYPSTADELLLERAYPVGVAGIITPWNFPLAIPLWKSAPAIAYGNAVVLKPATPAAACGQYLAGLFNGLLPDGTYNVVHGGAATARAVIGGSDVVSFTGSEAVGRSVATAGAQLGIPVQAEMGGQNAAVVLGDADVERTARMIAAAAMGFAGQKCTATSRVIVVGDPAPMVEALSTAVAELQVGDPADGGTVIGPVIDSAAQSTVAKAAEAAVARGSRLISGGRPLDRHGWYVEPTLLADVPAGDAVLREEVFGPLLAVVSAPTLEAAIAESNASRYGLVTGVYTNDVGRILKALDLVESGMIKVNRPTTGVDFHASFGGEKGSSVGPREQGKSARAFFTRTRTVTVAA